MTTSLVTDTNQRVNGGRRKTKGAEKKHKQPRRGKGVAQLEHERKLGELMKNRTEELPSLYPRPLIPSVPFSASGHFLPATVYGPNLYPAVHAMDPSLIKSSNAGFRFENSRELSSVPNYVKCASGSCGVCHKKTRINGGSNICSVNPFGGFGQVKKEYEFFPGKLGGGAEGYKEFIRLGSTATTWCGSGGSVAGGLGLRGGEGSCVTAVTGSEEGSVSSLDLSLKL